MRRALFLFALIVALVFACAGVVLAQTATPTTSESDAPKKTPKEKISGSYIVVLKDDADPDQVVEKKKQEIKDLKVKHVYKAALKGFAVEIPDEEASKLRDHPDVKYVEQDQVMTAIAQDTNPKKSAKRKPGSGSTTPPTPYETSQGKVEKRGSGAPGEKRRRLAQYYAYYPLPT